MATATQKKGRSKVVQKSAVEQISSLLQQLPKKEKQELPLGEAIAEMAEMIQAALSKGYSYDELSGMLSDKLGVSVSVWSLRRYLSAATQGEETGKTVTKTRRGRKAKSRVSLEAISTNGEQEIAPAAATLAIAPEAAAVAESPTSAPVAEAPAKKRGSRTAAKADGTAESPAKKRGGRTKTAAAAKADGTAKTTTRKPRKSAAEAPAPARRGRKKTT